MCLKFSYSKYSIKYIVNRNLVLKILKMVLKKIIKFMLNVRKQVLTKINQKLNTVEERMDNWEKKYEDKCKEAETYKQAYLELSGKIQEENKIIM